MNLKVGRDEVHKAKGQMQKLLGGSRALVSRLQVGQLFADSLI